MVNANELLLHDISLYNMIFASKIKFASFVVIFLGSQYLRMKQKLCPIEPEIHSFLQHCFFLDCKHYLMLFELTPHLYVSTCQAGEVSDTDPYFHIQLNKVHTVKPHVQAKCLHFKSKPPCFWFCVWNWQKYRIELNWPMTNDHDKSEEFILYNL